MQALAMQAETALKYLGSPPQSSILLAGGGILYFEGKDLGYTFEPGEISLLRTAEGALICRAGSIGCPVCVAHWLRSREQTEPIARRVFIKDDPLTRGLIAWCLDRADRMPDGTYLQVNLHIQVVSSWPLHPWAGCPSCTHPQQKRLVWSDGLEDEVSSDYWRAHPLDSQALAELARGPAAPFHDLVVDLLSPWPTCVLSMPRGHTVEPAIGRGETFTAARSIAILEALERSAGWTGQGLEGRKRARYSDLGSAALDPRRLGSMLPEMYEDPTSRYEAFNPETEVTWVEAVRWPRQDIILVPECAATWGALTVGDPRWFYETSNGWALGGSPAEALLHALREVIERDSFLMTWHLRRTAPELDLRSSSEAALHKSLSRFEQSTGFRVRAFETTMDYTIPSVMVVAQNLENTGPQVVFGSACDMDLSRAVRSALPELASATLALQQRYPRERDRGLRMLDDFDVVQSMSDHSLLWSLPEAADQLTFLLDQQPDTTLKPCPLSRLTIGTLLDRMVTGLASVGLDVIVVNQTTPQIKRLGLSCVRALVPGTVPMTFGHRNRRHGHLPRLIDDPAYNSDPHPFP